MIEDPIVAEVRRARDEILRKFNYDRRALFEDVRKRQAEGGRQIVSFPPRPADEDAMKLLPRAE
jgi:hypothetical protein